MLFALAACAAATVGLAAQPAAGADSAPAFEIIDVQAVRLHEPAEFVRNGEKFRRRDAVLVRVRVAYPGAFIPRALTAPFFVYGTGVCDTVISPFLSREAVLLCPIPEPRERRVLWMTRVGELSTTLRGERAEAAYGEATRPGAKRAAPLEPPPASAPKKKYPDARTLRRDALEEERSKKQ